MVHRNMVRGKELFCHRQLDWDMYDELRFDIAMREVNLAKLEVPAGEMQCAG
jgi:hypothetical protein